MDDRKDPEAADYVVGYGRPPKATQFAPGKSGNPRGRPKGSRTLKLLLPLIDRYAASPETELRLGELLAEDQAILSQYLSSPAGPACDCAKASEIEGLGDGV